jgi:gamma-glutamylcyclotransferase (GGCT)/AIG2-like uncharacterized protein YtfP
VTAAAPLGVYGTLLDADVRRLVMGAAWRVPGRPARLPGWARFYVAGAAYPGIRVRPGAAVDVELFDDPPPVLLARVDRFEGAEYRRCLLRVVGADGRAEEAWLYVPAPGLALSARPWRLDAAWRRRHKPAFLGGIAGFTAPRESRRLRR